MWSQRLFRRKGVYRAQALGLNQFIPHEWRDTSLRFPSILCPVLKRDVCLTKAELLHSSISLNAVFESSFQVVALLSRCNFPLSWFPSSCPWPCTAHELALCCIERNTSLMKIVERETGRAAATNAGAAIFLGVVAGMAAALGLDPLTQL
jgi:hypothetical protein